MAIRYGPEEYEQVIVVSWFEKEYPEYAGELIHIANQRRCTPQYGKKLKEMGVKAGVADIFIPIPTILYNGLWIEMKTKDGKLTKVQKDFLELKNKRGFFASVAYGHLQAKKIIKSYFSE